MISPGAVFLVTLLVLGAHAVEEPMDVGLASDKDTTLFKRLISSLKVTADEDKAYATMLAPTDRAVNAFLVEMGLTFDELLARPVLVDQILSYHMIPGIAITDWYKTNNKKESLLSSDADKPTVFTTGDVNSYLEVYRSPITDVVTIVDAQGYRSFVVAGGIKWGNIVFYDISAVLMSSSYFFTSMAAMRFYPEWSAASALYSKAALHSEALAQAFIGHTPNTFLMPNNDALTKVAKPLLQAPSSDLAQVMEYHVVPGVKSVPSGWKSGATVETKLPGNTLTSYLNTIKTSDYYTGQSVNAPDLTLVSNAGSKAHANIYNIYAGKSVIIGLDAGLLPKIPAATKLAAAATGRKLLQRHRSGSRGHASNWSAMNTQAAIRAAARGNASASSAARAGSRNAQLASRCPNCLRWNNVW